MARNVQVNKDPDASNRNRRTGRELDGRSAYDAYGDGGRTGRSRYAGSGQELTGRYASGTSGRSSREDYGTSGGSSRKTYRTSGRSSREDYGTSGGSSREAYGTSGRSSREASGTSGGSRREASGTSGGSRREAYGTSGRSSREASGTSGGSSREAYGSSGRSRRRSSPRPSSQSPARRSSARRAATSAAGAAEYGYTRREWDRINEQDRRERKAQRKLVAVLLVLLAVTVLLGYFVWYFLLRSHDYDLDLSYSSGGLYTAVSNDVGVEATVPGFAADLCVVDSDQNTDMLSLGALSAGLFDLTENRAVYAKDVYAKRSPASLTKIMTCLVALKYGRPDDIVTVTDTVLDIEYGSSVCDIKEGDQISLRQLLYGLMVASGNDAAMMIAEHVGGSVQGFVDLMNQEAKELGATRTHFANPHGLTNEDHYSCVYDLYLMFRAAMQNDMFLDMISRKNYYAEYRRGDGSAVAVTWESTNHYFTGESDLPDNVIIYGGKTGTTEDAGACLFLLVKDLYGNPYIAGLMHAADKDVLYTEMNGMLSLVNSV